MAAREGSWWSRAWGAFAVVAFALHLGAALYEAAVVAPLWTLAPPQSVSAWAALASRPDSSALFQPLVVLILVSTTMAWISGIGARGWRRWWLTLALAAALALAGVTLLLLRPCERQLFGASALGTGEGALLVSLTGDWLRAAALRFAALAIGCWAGYRAQLAGLLASRNGRDVADEWTPIGDDEPFVLADDAPRPKGRRRRRAPEFALGDEDETGVEMGDDPPAARERWRSSLSGGRRTAKK